MIAAELGDRLVVLCATFPAIRPPVPLLLQTHESSPLGAPQGYLPEPRTAQHLRRQGLPLQTKTQVLTRGRDREFGSFVHRQGQAEEAFPLRERQQCPLGRRRAPIVRAWAAYGTGTA